MYFSLVGSVKMNVKEPLSITHLHVLLSRMFEMQIEHFITHIELALVDAS